ncbi:MAG: DUF1282 family protein, partial [Vallitaleaceae bacterium]|nr:DUF1282 family protein [Vallitaleaceae bacterium]
TIIGIFILWKILKLWDRKKKIFAPLRKLRKRIMDQILIQQIFFMKYLLKNPADGYYGIRREAKTSYLSAHVLLVLVFLISVFDKYFTSYIFRYVREGRYEIFEDFISFIAVISLLIVSNYLVTTISDGEARFQDVYQGFAYALAPYILIKPILILLSHTLTYNEVFILNFGNFAIQVWTATMMVLMIKYINDYTFKETFKIILYTLFTVLIAVLVLFIVYVLFSQVVDFVQSIIGEAVYRIAEI